MNFVETNTWQHFHDHIQRLDPDRRGWCIDVGIGDDDYYFEWFFKLGYPTLAIEPLPTDKANRAVEDSHVAFMQAALGAANGETHLHTARGIHSLYDGLWGESVASEVVKIATWKTVLERTGINRITALKLDIEGAESLIIRQLEGNPLPAVLSFEFGGVWTRASGHGPWGMARTAEVMLSLRLLWGLGYREGVVISSGDSDHVQPITLERRMDIDKLFSPDCGWGNIVVWREVE